MRLRRITVEQFEYVAFALARESLAWSEPIPPFQSRFPDRLESCLATPFGRFGGKDLYRGILAKAAIFFYLLIKNHPFQNGNKRIAIVGLFYLLHSNGYWLDMNNATLYDFARDVAASRREDKEYVIDRINATFRKHLVRLDGKRPHLI